MVLPLICFVLSVIGIGAMFVIKHREIVGECELIPVVRARLDARAHQARELARAATSDLKRLPPECMHVFRISVHAVALWMARVARTVESSAHRLADRASYKHRFERRAPRSEFLQKIIEHKNGVEIRDETVHNGEGE